MTGNECNISDMAQDCTYSSRISELDIPHRAKYLMKQLLLVLGLISASCPALCFAAEAPPAAAATPAATPAPNPADGGAATPPAAANAQPKPAAAAAPATSAASPQVQVVTSMGSFTVELNAERAPLTVAHFLKNVDQGQYSGTTFHRVIANFVIQGGGFDSTYKLKAAPTKVVNESGNGLTNQRGTVGMARSQEPHSSDAQFYVNLYDNEALDPNKTRWGYAVFGKVVQGMEVVDRIGNVATGARAPFKEDAPLKPVVIERIERVASP
jgi:peptidyl-prolyl cis-trans isomerase A (cyclophilin A)/peptidyl-prolyl cis-trans isomerase B (cyclophilin B)